MSDRLFVEKIRAAVSSLHKTRIAALLLESERLFEFTCAAPICAFFSDSSF